MQLTLATADDLPFLQALYASTRSEELAATGWSAQQQADFIAQQFDAQHRHYQEHYREAAFSVVHHGHEPIGRFYVFRGPTIYNLMDLSLLPGWRGHGIGGHLLAQLVREADSAARAIRLYVEQDNPARRLYERFGFAVTGQHPIYLQMHRPATQELAA
ncbi:GNAT family N-acetyltransferase [Chitiniphilus purpureus]|uniref:GNAT family N-acetyltransferase n=1 Tax=Chitiniphilus purpureus TaxID=2981137 RepID=A0ABY6DLR4_9NEIS|nr:GNAT family N-acetyltransferase [Chitiniphilus sp. CD1]UXY15300.1 GNAT family N-acetyltransferase [Chitiniphilus sp. CD1]